MSSLQALELLLNGTRTEKRCLSAITIEASIADEGSPFMLLSDQRKAETE
jgi:hypothetical protein